MSAATGALAPVVEKLAALLGQEYNRFKGVRGERLFLKAELEHMHAFGLPRQDVPRGGTRRAGKVLYGRGAGAVVRHRG